METENINITEVCRACFETCEHFKFLFEQAENIENQTLADIFSDVVKIEMDTKHSEIPPYRICLTCLDDLINAYNFIRKSQKSNELLIQFLNEADINQTHFKTEINIDDVPYDQSIMDSVQIKIEKETLHDYNDFMVIECKNSSINSCDSEMNDCEPVANKKAKNPKLHCEYCNRVFKKHNLYEDHMRTHTEENIKNKGVSEDGNRFSFYENYFGWQNTGDMEQQQKSEHKTRKTTSSERMRRFRQKLKDSPEDYHNYLQRERERDKKRRQIQKEKEKHCSQLLIEKRRKDTLRKRKYLQRKAEINNTKKNQFSNVTTAENISIVKPSEEEVNKCVSQKNISEGS